MSLSGATTPGQNEPGSDGNEGVLCIPQSSSTARTSLLDCLVSYPGHTLMGSYPSAEVQSVYSTVPTEWAITSLFMIQRRRLLITLSYILSRDGTFNAIKAASL